MENVFVLVEWEDEKDPCILGVFKTLDASELYADKSQEYGPWSAWRATPHNANRRQRYSLGRMSLNQAVTMYEVRG